MGAALLLLHAPLCYLAFWLVYKPLLALALVVLCIAAWIAPRLSRRVPRLFKVWLAIYYLGVVVGLVLPSFFLRMIHLWCVALPALLALAALICARRRIPGLLVGLCVLGLALWLAAPMRLEHLIVIAVLGSAGLALGLVHAFSALPRRSIAFAVYGALSALMLMSFLSSVPTWRTDEVLAQPGVRPLYLAADRDSPLYELIGRGSEPRFALIAPDLQHALIGVRGERPGIVVRDRNDAARSWRLEFEGDVSDNAVWDIEAGLLIAADYGANRLRSFDLHDLRTERVDVPSPAKLPGLWRISEDGATLLLLHDATSEVYSIDPLTLAVRGAVSVGWNAALVLDQARGKAWQMSNTGVLTQLDLADLTPGRQTRIKGFTYFNLALDPREPALYVASMSTGELVVFDPQTLEVKRRAILDRGIRQLALLPGGELAVADFLHGELLIVDSATLRVRSRIQTGPRPRWPALAPDGRSLTFASALGAFEIDLDALEPSTEK
ncbi:MAG: hypothetical protein P9M14_07680 [Candidatus Alcyoniella australis]|nr:hypothetical protein [Candidatus Alcyoniella australis]